MAVVLLNTVPVLNIKELRILFLLIQITVESGTDSNFHYGTYYISNPLYNRSGHTLSTCCSNNILTSTQLATMIPLLGLSRLCQHRAVGTGQASQAMA